MLSGPEVMKGMRFKTVLGVPLLIRQPLLPGTRY